MSKVGDRGQTDPRDGPRHSRALTISLYAAFICIGALLAYYWEFQGFSGWDDEGYLMMTVKQFLQGHPLYDQVYTQYGPFSYAFRWLVFGITGVPVTNDSVRFLAVGIWLLYTCFCSWAILRITRSLSMATLGFMMTILAVSRVLRWGPGHPNDLSGLLMTSLIFVAAFLAETPAIALPIAAVICMAAILVKVNAGVYLTLGLIAGLLPFTNVPALRRLIYPLFVAAAIAFPTLLMKSHWHDSWAISLDVVITLALASAFYLTAKIEVKQFIAGRTWLIAIVTALVFGVAIVGAFLASGTSLSAMLYGSVLQHLGTDKEWYIPVSQALSWHCALVTLGGLSLMLWVSRDPVRRAASKIVILLKLTLWFVLLVLTLLNTGPNPLRAGEVILVDAPAFLWLTLLPPDDAASAGTRPFRYLLVFTTLFMLLFPYPVAGDHADMPAICMVVAFILCLHDAIIVLRSMFTQVREGIVRSARRLDAFIEPSIIIFSGVMMLAVTGYNYRQYHARESLGLPGAYRVHLKSAEVADFQALVHKINEDCSGFITMPGLDSLYFWTGQAPPTMINMSNWVTLLPLKYQFQTIRTIEGKKKDCVIENDYWVEWWRRGQDLNEIPLVSYIRKEFRPYDQVGDYRILVRRDRSAQQDQ